MNRMKKMAAFLLIAALSLFTVSCGDNAKANNSPKPMELYEHGLDVIAIMDEMVKSESYAEIYTVSTEIADIVNEIGSGDYSQPRAIYELKIPKNALGDLYAQESGADIYKEFSEELQTVLNNKLNATVISLINGMTGVNSIAAMSVCTASKLFVYEESVENSLYLYMYKNTAPVAVSFVTGDDGAVEAVGNFVMLEDLKNADKAFVEEFFANYSIEVEEIAMDK